MSKRTFLSVIVSGLFPGAAAANAGDARYHPTQGFEHGTSFQRAPNVMVSDLGSGYRGRGSAFPSVSRETGPALRAAQKWPMLDVDPDEYEGRPYPSAAREHGPFR